MKETICTIPVNDIFAQTQGCPVCRMYELIEAQYIDYITGDAMMAPDVRIETNKKGFCHNHYKQMMQKGAKLPNALLMQTRLDYIRENMLPESDSAKPNKAQLDMINSTRHSCYVCDRINFDVNHLLNTVFVEFANNEDFRKMFENQEYICLNHYELMMRKAQSKGGIKSKDMKAFCETLNTLTKRYLDTLYDDVTHFTTMFDYRNANGDFKNSKDSVQRSVRFLTSKDITE